MASTDTASTTRLLLGSTKPNRARCAASNANCIAASDTSPSGEVAGRRVLPLPAGERSAAEGRRVRGLRSSRSNTGPVLRLARRQIRSSRVCRGGGGGGAGGRRGEGITIFEIKHRPRTAARSAPNTIVLSLQGRGGECRHDE